MSRNNGLTRRGFLRKSAVAGAAILGGTAWASLPVTARARGRHQSPIRHLVISCQENRSFDHYFGYAHQVQRKGYGPPPGFSQPDMAGERRCHAARQERLLDEGSAADVILKRGAAQCLTCAGMP